MGGRGGYGSSNGGLSSAERKDIMSRLPDPPRTTYDLPELEGSEKQKKWAEQIRQEIVEELSYYAADYTSDGRRGGDIYVLVKGKKAALENIKENPLVTMTSGALRKEKMNNAINGFVDAAARWQRFLSLVESKKSASFWIDHRTNQLKNFYNKKLKAYIDGK